MNNSLHISRKSLKNLNMQAI